MNRSLTALLCAGLALTTLARADSADDRFKALYTAEWNWRQQQFGGSDDEDHDSDPANNHLPDVGVAAQKARLAYWHDVLKQLDAIPTAQLAASTA